MTSDDIRALRKRLGWSQTDLANALSAMEPDRPPVHFTTISRWELGKKSWPVYLPRALRDIEMEVAEAATPEQKADDA